MKKQLLSVLALAISLSGLSVATPLPTKDKASSPLSASMKEQINQQVHTYLLNNPEILQEMVAKLRDKQEKQSEADSNKAVQASIQHLNTMIHDPHALTEGNPNAPITIVEFYDYQCSACAATFPQMQDFLKTPEGQKVRVVYRAVPFFGEASALANKAVIAAKAQNKGIDLHNALFKSGLIEGKLTDQDIYNLASKIKGLNVTQLKKDMQSEWVNNEIKTNMDMAKAIGLKATPGLLFLSSSKTVKPSTKNSLFINSAMTTQQLREYIQLLEKKTKSN